MERKRIVVFTGAGISKESGIPTYRDEDGLWKKYDPNIYCNIKSWNIMQDKMNEFYNERRSELESIKPNAAHEFIAELEKDFDVNVITQNVDNLHERAGSTSITHIHGELTKIRKEQDIFYEKLGDDSQWKDIGYGKLDLEGEHKDYRPAVVFFGEGVPKIGEASTIVSTADIFIIIGTSLQVYPAANLLNDVDDRTKIILVDPKADELDPHVYCDIDKISKKATESIEDIKKLIYE